MYMYMQQLLSMAISILYQALQYLVIFSVTYYSFFIGEAGVVPQYVRVTLPPGRRGEGGSMGEMSEQELE